MRFFGGGENTEVGIGPRHSRQAEQGGQDKPESCRPGRVELNGRDSTSPNPDFTETPGTLTQNAFLGGPAAE